MAAAASRTLGGANTDDPPGRRHGHRKSVRATSASRAERGETEQVLLFRRQSAPSGSRRSHAPSGSRGQLDPRDIPGSAGADGKGGPARRSTETPQRGANRPRSWRILPIAARAHAIGRLLRGPDRGREDPRISIKPALSCASRLGLRASAQDGFALAVDLGVLLPRRPQDVTTQGVTAAAVQRTCRSRSRRSSIARRVGRGHAAAHAASLEGCAHGQPGLASTFRCYAVHPPRVGEAAGVAPAAAPAGQGVSRARERWSICVERHGGGAGGPPERPTPRARRARRRSARAPQRGR